MSSLLLFISLCPGGGQGEDGLGHEPVDDLKEAEDGEPDEEAQVAADPAELVAERHPRIFDNGQNQTLVGLKVHVDCDEAVLSLIKIALRPKVAVRLARGRLKAVGQHLFFARPVAAGKSERPVGHGGLN